MRTYIIISLFVILALSFLNTLSPDTTLLDSRVDVSPPSFDVTGEVIYKGAYYSRSLEEVYYVIVEMENKNEVTFFTPSFLWLQLKVGSHWKYEFIKKNDKDFIPVPLKSLTDSSEEL